MTGAEALDGDVAEYETCGDAECPAHREGFGHAHLARVVRLDGEVAFERDS